MNDKADSPDQADRPHRPIRSFVLREGRLTPGQQRAFDTLWPKWGLEFSERELDLGELFGNRQPVYVEIGFGNGESLAEMARRHPDRNYIGIEVHRPGVGHLLLRLDELELDNVRVLREDAMEVLRRRLQDASLEAVQLFFPDPWHKKRHHKRRIVQSAFFELVARKLVAGGILHMATDWENYAGHMLAVGDAAPAFRNCAGAGHFSLRPDYRPVTKFEQRGQRLGHGVWDLIFVRRG